LKRQDERVEKIVGLFAAGRKAGADDGKGISAGFGAETTGDFLLEFGHAQIAFATRALAWHNSAIISVAHGWPWGPLSDRG